MASSRSTMAFRMMRAYCTTGACSAAAVGILCQRCHMVSDRPLALGDIVDAASFLREEISLSLRPHTEASKVAAGCTPTRRTRAALVPTALWGLIWIHFTFLSHVKIKKSIFCCKTFNPLTYIDTF